jgi:hypothetical protein
MGRYVAWNENEHDRKASGYFLPPIGALPPDISFRVIAAGCPSTRTDTRRGRRGVGRAGSENEGDQELLSRY